MDSFDITIFNRVLDAYLRELSTLSVRKQLHFLSRLFLWSKDPKYLTMLTPIRERWDRRLPRFCDTLRTIETHPPKLPKVPRKTYRAKATETYPYLKHYTQLFFRTLFNESIFNEKINPLDCIQATHLTILREKLVNDYASVFSLATSAVNFLSLSNYFFPQEQSSTTLEYFLRVGKTVTLSNPYDDADARIYFYTHAIINASHFYTKEIKAEDMPHAREIFHQVESVVDAHYDELSLDHKCEFLVCGILTGVDTKLKNKIYSELLNSISPEGMFFVNTENAHAERRKYQTLSSMEHTNILALMAFLPTELGQTSYVQNV